MPDGEGAERSRWELLSRSGLPLATHGEPGVLCGGGMDLGHFGGIAPHLYWRQSPGADSPAVERRKRPCI